MVVCGEGCSMSVRRSPFRLHTAIGLSIGEVACVYNLELPVESVGLHRSSCDKPPESVNG